VPANFLVGPGKTRLHLNWKPNAEGDLAGYNVYRSRNSDSGFVKLNGGLWHTSDFIDSTVQQDSNYFYRIEAVDTTAASSGYTATLLSHTVKMDQGILVAIEAGYDPLNLYLPDSITAFSQSLLQGYRYWIDDLAIIDIRYPLNLGRYSSVLYFFEDLTNSRFNWLPTYPLGLKAYVLGGGRLMMCGRKLTGGSFPYWYEFLRDEFGIDLLLQISPTSNFRGAIGSPGFPDVEVDSLKLAATGGRLNSVERFPGAAAQRVLYSFHSDPFDSSAEGAPVGLRAADTSIHAYYLSFPLYYLNPANARALITKVLTDFDEITGVQNERPTLPQAFRLYDAYPNPFNPTATIRFDIPKLSDVMLTIYDVLGKEIVRLVDERKPPGVYQVSWDADRVSSGVYFCRIVVAESGTPGARTIVDSKKLLLLK